MFSTSRRNALDRSGTPRITTILELKEHALDLPTVWFVLIGILLVGYAVLDGFDLGVGILHVFARGETERTPLIESIGPFWDGNEVWLVVFGGAMFAAFPEAYAAAFTAFYLPFLLLVVGLIFRAVAIEFRHHAESSSARFAWDVAFFLASLLVTFLYGVAVGNAIRGLPLNADREFSGTILDLLNPYALLIGVFAVTTFALHGSTFLMLRTGGALRARVLRWAWRSFGVFLALYVASTVATLVVVEDVMDNFRRYPWVWVVPVLNLLAIANIPRALYNERPIAAFVSSSAVIAAFTFLFGVALYPNLIASSLGPGFHLTIERAASSPSTLRNLLIAAAIGMPFVLAYTIVTYWVFRGKVSMEDRH
jgi:cytochrome d ubiquinol oxidase subunit II